MSKTSRKRQRIPQEESVPKKSKAKIRIKAFSNWLNQPVMIHDQPSVLTKNRHVFPKYVRQSASELTLISWPKFSTAIRLSVAVFLFATFFTTIVFILDTILTRIFERLFLN